MVPSFPLLLSFPSHSSCPPSLPTPFTCTPRMCRTWRWWGFPGRAAELRGRASSPRYTWSVTDWGRDRSAAAEPTGETESVTSILCLYTHPHTQTHTHTHTYTVNEIWHKRCKKGPQTVWTDGRVLKRRSISDREVRVSSQWQSQYHLPLRAALNMLTVTSQGRPDTLSHTNTHTHTHTHSFMHRHAHTKSLYCIHTPHWGRPHIRSYSFAPTGHLQCRLCRPDPA